MYLILFSEKCITDMMPNRMRTIHTAEMPMNWNKKLCRHLQKKKRNMTTKHGILKGFCM